ncbi:hypothetical protein MIND_00449900 [Mycena indigotica]|uniref:Uncharacterized protein n=1 Tax=Mycena indigotica TaxID=2126181 RepID=A0A8H6W873_9AGAR|nr:uncharacterized protein MIND_00449900 [Mycena indigotica]KAF7306586.1 hypothetical protein MIND_00449900 [Mycena indigotica]
MKQPLWWTLALLRLVAQTNAADALGFMDQSFYFSYTPPSQAVPVPVTSQCETIHLSWSRGAGTGPNPEAPYFLQVYTSAFVFPFIIPAGSGLSFDWQVPFSAGTLYQICMFDKNGNSGGCQDMFTTIPAASTPSCPNATFPLGPLEVDASVSSGPLSQYGWVDQCTDITVTPKNGTPPYIFTVAPTLHPPHNQTVKGQSPTSWTVNLSWGSSFFISVVDAEMNFWSYGPLHSGQGHSTSCLSAKSKTSVSPVISVASGLGGIVVGLVAGIAAAFLFLRRRWKRNEDHGFIDYPSGYSSNPFQGSSSGPAHYKPLNATHGYDGSFSPRASHQFQRESTNYHVEPFVMPGDPHEGSTAGSTVGNNTESVTGRNIYVVHHDAGRPPVTVYHADGTEVVELPPRYGNVPPDDGGESYPTSPTSSIHPLPSGSTSTRRQSSIAPSSVQEMLSPTRRPNRPSKP